MTKAKTSKRTTIAKKNKSAIPTTSAPITSAPTVSAVNTEAVSAPKRITLIEAVALVMEIKGNDFFSENMHHVKVGKYLGIYEYFMRDYKKFDYNHNSVTPAQLEAFFYLLIYIDSKSLPIYGSLNNERIHMSTMYLMSAGSWRKDFKELLTLYTTYQRITVEVDDILYLF